MTNEEEETVQSASPSPYWDGPVWNYFELSYAAHLVLSRRALCSMPREWQERFVVLLNEAETLLPENAIGAKFWVRRQEGGQFVNDPDSDYRHAPPYELRQGPPVTPQICSNCRAWRSNRDCGKTGVCQIRRNENGPPLFVTKAGFWCNSWRSVG